MCDPVSMIVAGSVLAAGATVYQAEKSASVQKKAMAQQREATANASKRQEIETNRANARSPDLAGIAGRNAAQAQLGIGSTMLTGAQGIDPGQMSLAQTSLLGA